MMQESKRMKEIAHWERVQQKPRSRGYFLYLILMITLIYTVDEVASQIGMLMKTEIANDLFARFGDSSVGALEILGAIGLPFQFLGLAYRPLADRHGRKVFLIINTFCMSLAMLVIYASQSVPVYFVGACMIQFFIPHDMHVVYIMESAPEKHRAKTYSVVKFVATLGVMLIPLLRKLLMEHAGEWREVYFYPALLGLITCLIALFFSRETDTFVEARLNYLRSGGQENKKQDKQGGLITGLKYAMKSRQLRWLYIAAALVNIGFLGTINYQVILSYGFAQGLHGSFSEAVMNQVSLGPVTEALVLFPVGCALSQLLIGFVSDGKGRKGAAVMAAAQCLVSFLCFFFGAKGGMAPNLVGVLCGVCIGSYYSLNDVIIMMVGESAPTNLRSSIMSAQFVVTAAGGLISYAIGLPLVSILGNQAMGVISFGLLVPGFVLALWVLIGKTRDTKGVKLSDI